MASSGSRRLLAAGWSVVIVALGNSCTAPPAPAVPSFRDMVEQVRRGESTEIVTADEPIGDAKLTLLSDLPELKHLAIEKFQGTEKGLRAIAELPNLQRLQLRGGQVGDNAMAVISRCVSLKNLNLPDASFSDEGLAALKGLPQLELLRFHTQHVSDEGLTHIAEMKSIRFLHLIGVPITDQGLANLEVMQQLESFYIDDTAATDEGIERLLKAVPGLHLHVDQQHSDRDPSKGTHPH
ncbi:MAG: hypothetical protein H6821_05815 [Planctomycetaceae bacterium]|nr:hypothetical protein [Planctomycetaceae bacterium]HRX80619.1 hypothetical protein [Pirellulaceae bacterium]